MNWAEDAPAYVPAGPSIGRRDDWLYVIDSLIGGLETYDGVLRWLSMYSSLDDALVAARGLRGSPFT